MTDREKVIRGLECCEKDVQLCYGETVCEYYSLIPRCWTTLAHDALALLKAQEPVKPLVAGRGKSFETAETWWYECGNCGGVLTLDDKYCRKCGREVKWE